MTALTPRPAAGPAFASTSADRALASTSPARGTTAARADGAATRRRVARAPGASLGGVGVTPPRLRVLVSVRSVDEARLAARAGVDFVDLKEPSHGALGGLPTATLRAIVAALAANGPRPPVSATLGDLDAGVAPDAVVARARATAACGVDHVKVGLVPGPQAARLADALAECRDLSVIPVLIADDGVDEALVARLLARVRDGARFPALMLDTATKHGGSLRRRVDDATLARFVAAAREAGVASGLAGSLTFDDLPALARLGPDFTGWRGAVCAGDRTAPLDATQLDELLARVRRSAG